MSVALKEGWRGRLFEDFEVGEVYEHPLGRTVTTTEVSRPFSNKGQG
jgi:acyl dehydratase